MLDNLEFKKIRDFGETINDTFVFIKQNLKPILKVFLYFCGVFILAGMISSIMQQLGLGNVRANPYSVSAVNRSIFFSVLTFFLGIVNYTAINVSILSFIILYIEKGNVAPTLEEVWGYFKYYFFRALLSSVVIFLFFIVCFAFFLIPGFYVFPAMSLFFPVMVIENGSFGYSFSRSFALLKNQWWVTAGSILILWVVTYALIMLASLPALSLTMASTFVQGSKTSTVYVVFYTVIQYVCQIFMALPVIGAALCYFNLVERRENAGLLSRIDQVGQTKDDFSNPEEY